MFRSLYTSAQAPRSIFALDTDDIFDYKLSYKLISPNNIGINNACRCRCRLLVSSQNARHVISARQQGSTEHADDGGAIKSYISHLNFLQCELLCCIYHLTSDPRHNTCRRRMAKKCYEIFVFRMWRHVERMCAYCVRCVVVCWLPKNGNFKHLGSHNKWEPTHF